MRLNLSTCMIALCLTLPLPALASDIGTYRPGQAYLSVPANNPGQCVEQCQGDAQCKGWNFIQMQARQNRPQQAICEFNARKATPIPHYMSISGDNQTTTDSPRIIPVGYRTTKIGQPMVNKTISTQVRRIGQSPISSQPATSRPFGYSQMSRSHSVTRPIQQPAPRIASTTSAPRLQHLKLQLDVMKVKKPAAIIAPTTPPSFQPQLDTNERPVFSHPNKQQETASNGTAPPQIQKPQVVMPSAPMPRLSNIEMGLPPRSALRAADPRLAGAPISVARAQQSLFGSLYDDVKAPRALSLQDIPVDPDAPIPTVSSVPVARIDQSPL